VLTPIPKDLPTFKPSPGLPTVEPAYVPPGRLHASRDPKPLTTIVSTGAAVCVWDAVTGAGGMAHFLLPEAGNAPPATRFGDVALRTMVEELGKLGVAEKRLRARVFGGSAPPVATTGGHLGDRNVAAALSFLKARFIPIVENQVGGTTARKIVFTPATGTATAVSIGLTPN
jgi:chemotaxis protein CheD